MSTVTHFYRIPGFIGTHALRKLHSYLPSLINVETEFCYNVETATNAELDDTDVKKLLWLFAETFEPENVSRVSFLDSKKEENITIVEVGPRLAFTTAWSSNCVSMCRACGVNSVVRVERSRRYLIRSDGRPLSPAELSLFISHVHDRMTECLYVEPLHSFANNVIPQPFTTIPVLEEGRQALEKINREKGLGFDDWDLDFYTTLFRDTIMRNPTDVECFDLGQSNSEHSRHWFFGGKMIINGEEKQRTLFSLVKGTLPNTSNSIIAFHDNSSVWTNTNPSLKLYSSVHYITKFFYILYL